MKQMMKMNEELISNLSALEINPYADPTNILSELEDRYEKGEKTMLLSKTLTLLSDFLAEEEETTGIEETLNALTYYGKEPRKKNIKRRTDFSYYDYQNHDREKQIQQRRTDVMRIDGFTPQLGELDNLTRRMTIHSLPVTTKGSLLLCDSVKNAAQEIKTWEEIMKQAIAMVALQDKKELTKEEKLSYYEMCMGGNALLAWNAVKRTPAWTDIQQHWNQTEGTNSIIPDFFLLHFCGIRSNTITEQKQREMAKDQLNKIQLCDMSGLEAYNETFSKLLLITGEPYSKELLNLYFTKLPDQWDVLMKERYVVDELDCFGTRKAFLNNEIEKLCREKQLRKAASQNITKLCSNIKQPKLKFGCYEKPIRTYERLIETKLYGQRKRKPTIRKAKPIKPRFKRNSQRLVRKPEQQVTCWGCKQTGHYANKCPNKKDLPIKHIRNITLIEKALEEGLLLKDEYLSNSDDEFELTDFESESENE